MNKEDKERLEREELLSRIRANDATVARCLAKASIELLREVAPPARRTGPLEVWRAPSAAQQTLGSVAAVIDDLKRRGRARWGV
jgi:hypothetical protein